MMLHKLLGLLIPIGFYRLRFAVVLSNDSEERTMTRPVELDAPTTVFG